MGGAWAVPDWVWFLNADDGGGPTPPVGNPRVANLTGGVVVSTDDSEARAALARNAEDER